MRATRLTMWMIGLLGIGLLASTMGDDTGELVPNGAFSKGDGKQARNWSKMDGITTFWDRKGGNPGGCLKLDTSVLQVDKKKFIEAPEKFQGKSKGGKYSTVGAHEGVWAFSPPIPVKPDQRFFILQADVKGPAKSTPLFYPQVFVRGFQKYDPKKHRDHNGASSFFHVPREGGPAFSEQFGKEQRKAHDGDYLMSYRHSLVCRLTGPDKWHHFEMGIKLPTMKKFIHDVFLLKCYAMWPLGEYFFDNVKMRPCTEDQYRKARFKGHSIKGFMPTAEDAAKKRKSRPRRSSPRTSGQ